MKVGDEGIKRGTRWFIMTAVIVEKNYDTILSNKIIEIKKSLNIAKESQLHWTKFKKSYKKREYILKELKEEHFTIIHVAIDTNNILYLKPVDIYPYFLSYLFERVCFFLVSNKAIGYFYISTRSDYSTDKYNFIKNELSNKRPYHKIRVDRIKRIKFVSNNKMQLLQLADVCSSSFSQCLIYNEKEFWDLAVLLKNRIRKYKNSFINAGIKFYPPIEWINEYPYLINFN